MTRKAALLRRSLLLAIAFPQLSFAFSGTEGASFLEIPVGARPAAFGNAYTALANDAYAPTLNPGGLGFLQKNEFSAMHLIYVQDTAYEYASFVHPFNESHGLGAAVQYFRPGSITGLDVNANPIGDINGYYAAYSLAYGQRLTSNWSLGVTGKMIHAKIDDVSASAYALDGGTFYRVNDKLQLAAVFQNLGSKLDFLQTGDPLPFVVRTGAAISLFRGLIVSGEGAFRRSGVYSFDMGLEYRNAEGYALRGGYDTERIRQLSPLAGASVGVGIPVWGHELAYTWVPLSDLGTSHYLSFVFRFGPDASRENESSLNFQPVPEDYILMNEMLDAQ